MASLAEMRERLEVRREEYQKILEATVIEEGDTRAESTIESELSDALMLIDDCVKMFEGVLDPRSKGKVSKIKLKNMEDLLQQLIGFLSLYDDDDSVYRGDEPDVSDDDPNWEVAYIKGLESNPNPLNPMMGMGKSWKRCDECGGWGNRWEKNGPRIKCFVCVGEERSKLGSGKGFPKCNFCGKKDVELVHGDVKSCRTCYQQFERGEI